MRRWRALAVGLAVVTLAGCTSSPPSKSSDSSPGTGQATTKVFPGVSVTLPASAAVHVTGRASSVSTASLTSPAPAAADGARLSNPIVVVSPPVTLTADGPLPVAGAGLSFHLPTGAVGKGDLPMLASYDAGTKSWTAIESSWDAASGNVSATVPHFSVWVAIVLRGVDAALKGALDSILGTSVTPSFHAKCADAPDLSLAIKPAHGPSACGQDAGAAHVQVKVVNDRRYPIDVQSPAAATIKVDDGGNLFQKVGAALTRASSGGKRLTLLVPRASATVTMPIAAGQFGQVATHFDDEAYLLGIMGLAVDELTMLKGKLGGTWKTNLTALAQGRCVAEIATLPTDLGGYDEVRAATSVALDCVRSYLELGVKGLWADIYGLVVGLVTALEGGVVGLVDSVVGSTDHLYTVSRKTPVVAPTVYLPTGGWGAEFRELRPASAVLSGDSTLGFDKVTWRTWTSTGATGVGSVWMNGCNPDCASGPIRRGQATLVLSRPAAACGRHYFGLVIITFFAATDPLGGPRRFVWSEPSDGIRCHG